MRGKMQWLRFSLVCVVFAVVQGGKTKDGWEIFDGEVEEKSSDKRWIADNQPKQPQLTLSKELPTLNLQTATKGQERAKEEKTFKDFVGYEAIQNVLLNALKPKPILDTAEESEKLAPNEGSKAQALGDLVIKGSETLSRTLNTVIDGPRKVFNKLSTGATQALNQLGAYLIGL